MVRCRPPLMRILCSVNRGRLLWHLQFSPIYSRGPEGRGVGWGLVASLTPPPPPSLLISAASRGKSLCECVPKADGMPGLGYPVTLTHSHSHTLRFSLGWLGDKTYPRPVSFNHMLVNFVAGPASMYQSRRLPAPHRFNSAFPGVKENPTRDPSDRCHRVLAEQAGSLGSGSGSCLFFCVMKFEYPGRSGAALRVMIHALTLGIP
ncbi:hypothetical protein B0T19DRAFT_406050 [Cercophora scortea]|uniref:Uncharacterized protein n=1 Tax=Cercophora scortea TaxID=314031 RepID=A0AAE0MJZ9_9PEZI|nr:hypothetical protein B0T19DRAFT_406050 [Cercophora scortea]